MNFTDALQALMTGKYVTRSIWIDSANYLVLLPNQIYIWKISSSASVWTPSVSDLLADDWQIME